MRHFSNEVHLAIHLPTPSTVFIGREQELNRISALLSDPGCWLLTLLGPGGIGKTRLAIEVGRINSAKFPEGVIFIPLSMVEAERSIVPAMASAIGLIFRQDGPPPEEQLLDFLGNKHLLLILDAFEQLVPWADFLSGSIHLPRHQAAGYLTPSIAPAGRMGDGSERLELPSATIRDNRVVTR